MNIVDLSIKYKQLIQTYQWYLDNAINDVDLLPDCKSTIVDKLDEEINKVQKLLYDSVETSQE